MQKPIEGDLLKIYLDDERKAPDGWVKVLWPDEVVLMLEDESIHVEEISLDHDLGDDNRGTGYDVVKWIEARVFEDPEYQPPKINVHTANSAARLRMLAGVDAIERRVSYNNSFRPMSARDYWLVDTVGQLGPDQVDAGWHFCSDWDYLLIHNTWPEMDGCHCSNVENKQPDFEEV